MFDYWCLECGNYVLLEWNKDDKELISGWCALCGKNISMSYESYEIWNKKEK